MYLDCTESVREWFPDVNNLEVPFLVEYLRVLAFYLMDICPENCVDDHALVIKRKQSMIKFPKQLLHINDHYFPGLV